MQLSYLPLAWLNNTEQSIVKKQLIVKLDTPLPQILALMKNSIPLWVEFLGMGNGEWGMGNKLPMPGDYPSTDTWGSSFPSLSMKTAIAPMRLSCTAFFRIVAQVEGNSCQA
ncbi:MAG: hypothetical protein ICV54_04795 [Nostoc sp. C3-bin3]|nr:hypothetical protein [Nostoc sp. C3-bin3]